MTCDDAKTAIEADYLAKTNGLYADDVQTHLLSCRKCRGHGALLARILQTVQLERVKTTPDALVTQILGNMPALKKKSTISTKSILMIAAAVATTVSVLAILLMRTPQPARSHAEHSRIEQINKPVIPATKKNAPVHPTELAAPKQQVTTTPRVPRTVATATPSDYFTTVKSQRDVTPETTAAKPELIPSENLAALSADSNPTDHTERMTIDSPVSAADMPQTTSAAAQNPPQNPPDAQVLAQPAAAESKPKSAAQIFNTATQPPIGLPDCSRPGELMDSTASPEDLAEDANGVNFNAAAVTHGYYGHAGGHGSAYGASGSMVLLLAQSLGSRGDADTSANTPAIVTLLTRAAVEKWLYNGPAPLDNYSLTVRGAETTAKFFLLYSVTDAQSAPTNQDTGKTQSASGISAAPADAGATSFSLIADENFGGMSYEDAIVLPKSGHAQSYQLNFCGADQSLN